MALPGVLVVTAMPVELKWLRPRKDLRWIKSVAGPGFRLVSRTLSGIDVSGVDLVVSAGICGAVDPKLAIADVVVATAVNGRTCSALGSKLGSFRKGPIASLDRVANWREKQELRRSGVVVVEMEAAEVQRRAEEWAKPFYCVKAVSDTSEEKFLLDLNASRDEMGSFRTGHILKQALAQPFRGIPELLRLKRNSEWASRALGDFLADCSF